MSSIGTILAKCPLLICFAEAHKSYGGMGTMLVIKVLNHWK